MCESGAARAPLVVRLGNGLLRVLDAGVRVLPQHEWEARERELYRTLYQRPVRTPANGTLVLPALAGRTLATVLEDSAVGESDRARAIQLAVAALAAFHRAGFTHGDAMAENVLVDLADGVAHWLDFETVHDESRSIVWRRADDVRALVATCVIRTPPESRAAACAVIADAYADGQVTRVMAMSFASVWQRSLIFHLAQAPLEFRCFGEIGRLLKRTMNSTLCELTERSV